MFIGLELNLLIMRQGKESGRSAEGSVIRTSNSSVERAILAGEFAQFLVFVHAKCCKWKREEEAVWTVSVGCWAVFLLRR